ncbi:gluconate 2-dehydrogenase subunit 3 family protein [Trinickia dinghuensis]|uniref:Gluconate 2-dehydrogenase subunit 3 family protein n=1 Tax=Trinickia dinghuensis TaxID=2291023 RepID=A0A3D8JYX9_9BURK|nr:gluconate 2-dehydrogenase subunit 3 family protein [Trinickia dinghuensis]RDU97571.1 gluconate 2-dehydrogenase subunit 3 family protein [Trinickia dinghuensis]
MSRSDRSRYPGYDVLLKRDTPSWDDVTREVVDARLATPNTPRFCNDAQWRALSALCAVLVPQSCRAASPGDNDIKQDDRLRWADPVVPVAAIVDEKLFNDTRDGYRDARMPPLRDAWRVGLAALDVESRRAHDIAFADLDETKQRDLVERMQRGELKDPAWEGMPSNVFFELRAMHDIAAAYYSHPRAWSEIGFGGPANPRGYVRMQANRRDPWEAAEAKPGDEERADKENRRAR